MSNPYAPPSGNESKTADFLWFRRAGYILILAGLMMPLIGETLIQGIPGGIIPIATLLVGSSGIALVAFSPTHTTESEKRRRALVWILIPFLAVVNVGGPFVIHTLRWQRIVQQSRLEALRAQEMAQRAAEESRRQFSDNKDSNSEPGAGN